MTFAYILTSALYLWTLCSIIIAAPIPEFQAEQTKFSNSSVLVPRNKKPRQEEYWLRYNSEAELKSDIFLPYVSKSKKAESDQAYKWIATDAKKAQPDPAGRIATLYVLPAGTRKRILGSFDSTGKIIKQGEAEEYTTVINKKAVKYVKDKPNEPGNLGIQAVQKQGSALKKFRRQIIRMVVKKVSEQAHGKASYETATLDSKGKLSWTKTATEEDQKAFP